MVQMQQYQAVNLLIHHFRLLNKMTIMNNLSESFTSKSSHSLRQEANLLKENSNAQAGFSMLEVLITVFILAVGLLGVAGMQATSIKLSHESHLRSQASLLAYDIADRMRANRASALAGNYDNAVGYTGNSAFDGRCRNPNGAACPPATITAVDLANWDSKLGQTFPGVLATIVTAAAAGQTISTITLIWIDTDTDDGVAAANAASRTFTLRTVI